MSDRPHLDFWCDESTHTNGQYMVVGGIALRSSRVAMVSHHLEGIRDSAGIRPSKELKWNEFKSHQRPVYHGYADYFASLLKANFAHYHVLIFDNHTIDGKAYPGANNASVLSRMYYQLFLHRCSRIYGSRCSIHLRPDRSSELTALPTLLSGLNADARRRFNLGVDPIRDIKPQDSARNHMLQLNDVILGSVAYRRNNRHCADDAARHKCEFAEAVQSKLGVSSYLADTPKSKIRCTVWNFRSKGRSGPCP